MNAETIALIEMIISAVNLSIFVVFIVQIRQVQRTIKTNTHQNLYSRDVELSKLILEHNAMEYFYSNKPLAESDPCYQKIQCITSIVATFFEQIEEEKPNLQHDLFKKWENFIFEIYNHSPCVRTFIHDNESWYSSTLVEKLKDQYAKKAQPVTVLPTSFSTG